MSWRSFASFLAGGSVWERRWRFLIGLAFLIAALLACATYGRIVADHRSRALFISGAMLVVILGQLSSGFVLAQIHARNQGPPRSE